VLGGQDRLRAGTAVTVAGEGGPGAAPGAGRRPTP